jgi:type I restriction enzyme R subunit
MPAGPLKLLKPAPGFAVALMVVRNALPWMMLGGVSGPLMTGIHKLRMNEALTALDLKELERMLKESGVGKADQLEQAKTESNGLGLFVRSLVGLDRQAAKQAMAGFMAGKILSANQIEFLNLVVEQLTAHGVMDAAQLYESPFTDINPHGPEMIFGSEYTDELIGMLNEIRQRAIA